MAAAIIITYSFRCRVSRELFATFSCFQNIRIFREELDTWLFPDFRSFCDRVRGEDALVGLAVGSSVKEDFVEWPVVSFFRRF